MFLALGAIMQHRGCPGDSDDQLKFTAKQLLSNFYEDFQAEPAFLQYVRQEWEGKSGEMFTSLFVR